MGPKGPTCAESERQVAWRGHRCRVFGCSSGRERIRSERSGPDDAATRACTEAESTRQESWGCRAVLAQIPRGWAHVTIAVVCMAIVAIGSQAASTPGSLRDRVLRPDELNDITMVSSQGAIQSARDLKEELTSLCIRTEPNRELRGAGFIKGYRESLVSKASGDIVFSVAARFNSNMQANNFARHDESFCGFQTGHRRNIREVTRLKLNRVTGAVVYRLGLRANTELYWMVVADGPYVYVESLLTSVPADHLFTGMVEKFYERVRKARR
jgi:hypothetical protein